MKVLFVCTANVCRSPYLQLRGAAFAGPGVELSSAGTYVREPLAMDPTMAQLARDRGAEVDGTHLSRPLGRSEAEAADLVLTAGAEHRHWILENWPALVRITFTLGAFDRAVRAAAPELRGQQLLDVVHSHRGAARPEDEILDPFGQGLDAAIRAADHMDQLLASTIPRLVAARGPESAP